MTTGRAEYIFAYGPVWVYEEKPNMFYVMSKTKYYWKYHDGDVVYGPFNTIKDTYKNFMAHMIASGRADGPITNVAVVDFKTKKRYL